MSEQLDHIDEQLSAWFHKLDIGDELGDISAQISDLHEITKTVRQQLAAWGRLATARQTTIDDLRQQIDMLTDLRDDLRLQLSTAQTERDEAVAACRKYVEAEGYLRDHGNYVYGADSSKYNRMKDEAKQMIRAIVAKHEDK
jgi:hypothetical protein